MSRSIAGLVLVLFVCRGAYGQNPAARSDTVYTWFIAESAAKPLILIEAAQFDRRYFDVFMDSMRVDGTTYYRLLLGQYLDHGRALRSEVTIPQNLKRTARLLHLPRGSLRVIPPNPEFVEESAPNNAPGGVADRQTDSLAGDGKLKIFLDCDACDFAHVRRKVAFVDWVRDRGDADVHVLVTSASSAAGREFTLYFIGLHRFSTLRDTLGLFSSSTDTFAERRTKLVNRIQAGLIRFVARTPQVDQIGVISTVQKRYTASRDDPWKSWTFKLSGNGAYSEEEATKYYDFGGTLTVSRVTDKWKIKLAGSGNYWRSEYELRNNLVTSERESGSLSGEAIMSLGTRWGAGVFSTIGTSSFRNTDLLATVAPAIEFNVFPYSESTRREFRFAYHISLRSFQYDEVTVFGKTEEDVLRHDLQAILESKETWGSAYVSLGASGYLTDFHRSLTDLYRIESYSYLEIRLVRGLSIWLELSASRIRDQLFLPLKSASEEEILLGSIQLPTDFSFGLSGGLTFTFGSIYNNVVNARFGS